MKDLFQGGPSQRGNVETGTGTSNETGKKATTKTKRRPIYNDGRAQTLVKKQLPRKPKPMVKDWRFYHTTGAVWSDVHRIPKHKLLFSQRPDLDAAFQERQEEKLAEEQEAKRGDVQRRLRSIRRQREALQRRRKANREKADQNGMLGRRPRVSRSSRATRRRGRGESGAVWCDA